MNIVGKEQIVMLIFPILIILSSRTIVPTPTRLPSYSFISEHGILTKPTFKTSFNFGRSQYTRHEVQANARQFSTRAEPTPLPVSFASEQETLSRYSTGQQVNASTPVRTPEGSAGHNMMGEEVGTGNSDDSNQSWSGGSCGARFLPKAMSKNITNYCIDLIGFNLSNFPPKEEDLIKINYRDKCFSKCYLNQLNYMTAADNFDFSKIEEEVKRETPRDKWDARLAGLNKCINKTAELSTDEGGVANSPCKYAMIFFTCARDEERKMIC